MNLEFIVCLDFFILIISNNEIFFIGKLFHVVCDNDLGLYVRDDTNNETKGIFAAFNDIIYHKSILEFKGQDMFYYYFKSSLYEEF